MRSILALAVVTSLGALTLAGCGTTFPLPTETRTGRDFASDESYQMLATWSFADSVADILLTQGSGSQLFILFNRGGSGTAPRGDVFAFALKARPPRPAPLAGIEFRSLFVPAALCAGASNVFVLDQGDSALARDPANGRVSDLSLTWRVRQYGLLGGDTLSTFTDTTMAFVRGVAADDQGRVYVSGSAIILIPDQQNPSIRTRAFEFRVYRYLPVSPGSTPPDPLMPGTDRWVRDPNYRVDEGSGLGTVLDPRGLYWMRPGAGGLSALFAADRGKNWIQKLSDAVSSTGFYRIDADSSSTLDGPADVTGDLAGYVYLTDTGNRRVLRYDPAGDFVQRVDVEPDADGLRLIDPVAVAADDSLVYVSDGITRKVVRYQRRR